MERVRYDLLFVINTLTFAVACNSAVWAVLLCVSAHQHRVPFLGIQPSNVPTIGSLEHIPLSNNRYSVLEYTDNIVDADESDADVICNEYLNENFPSEAEQKIDAEQGPARTKGKMDLSNIHTPILQESSTTVQTGISRPSVRETIRRFEAVDGGQKSEKSAQKGAKKGNVKIPCQEKRIWLPLIQ